MKLRNIFTMLAAALVLCFAGCQEPERFLDEVKVSQSYIALPAAGDEIAVEVEAAADWSIVALDDKFKDTTIPEWLTISPASGAAGKTTVTFSAGETTESREVTLNIVCGAVRQYLTVTQVLGKQEAPLSTLAEVLADNVVNKFYRVKGVVSEIPLADYIKYGKFYIIDESVDKQVQIYGCANKSAYLDGEKPLIDVGDVVVIEGSWSKYANFNNDTQILELEKSLIKVEKVSPVGPLAAEGDVFTVTLTNKGEDFAITIPEADQTWLTYSEPFVAGTTTVVEFTAAANNATPRSTTVTFSTTSGGVEYTASVAMEQNGSIPQRTIAEAVASGELSMVVGKVLLLNGKGALITDGTSALYGYTGAAVEGVAVGDVVEMVGTVTLYNGGRSMNKPTITASTATVPAYTAPAPIVLDAAKFAEYTATTADFATPYVSITGVAEVDSYNNIIVKLVDGETTYSVKSYYGLESFADWAGQTVEVRGYAYNAYNDSKQINLLVTSVQEPLLTLPTIAEVRAAADGNAVITEGTVVAVNKKGYVISDATGSIAVYVNEVPGVAVGNKVKVSGTFTNYYGTLQIKNPVVEANDNATNVTYPTPIDLTDPAVYEAYATYSAENPTDFAYVKIKGVLSGDYSSIVTVGESTKTTQFYYNSGDYSALNGKTVIVKGYMWGFHSRGYYQLSEVSVVEEGNESADPVTIVLDVTGNAPHADFPLESEGKVANEAKEYIINGYKWTFFGSNYFTYFSDTHVVIFGKQGAYITLPAVEGVALKSIDYLAAAGASASVELGVFPVGGETAVAGGESKVATKGETTNWTLTGTEVGTSYQLKVTNDKNSQFQKITLRYE